MTTVIERKTPVVEGPILIEPPLRPTPTYVRWLAWLLGIALVVGAGIVVWQALDEPVTPPIASIDPHDSPEILRLAETGVPALEAATIDPHQSPEVLRVVPGAPSLSTIDPHQSPEVLRLGS